MELKKRFDSRFILLGLYLVFFLVYIIIGLKPADAKNYEISAELSIPSISLDSDVTALTLENNELKTPDTIVGSFSRAKNKTLLIGHSTTVFSNLNMVEVGDKIFYDENEFIVSNIDIIEKSNISMRELLASADKNTILIMTCAGTIFEDGDATHRLIITAVEK